MLIFYSARLQDARSIIKHLSTGEGPVLHHIIMPMTSLLYNNTGQIYYEDIEGDPEYPTLVFLHEGLGCQAMWKDFPRQLCRKTGCPGLVYDRLGFGKSSPVTSTRTIHYLHDSALHELPYVLEQCIPGRPFILIGHSDGGSISLIFSAGRPFFLQGIITEAAHVFVEPVTIAEIMKVDEAYKKGKMRGLSTYHREKTEYIFRAWADTWLSDWFQFWNIENLLPEIQCPMLVIQGREDQYGTERQVDAIISKSSGRAKPVLLDNCGHSPHREMPETVLDVMSGFVGQIMFF
jgi:pimeloyl-ACP methyl ester carboxylesterase